MPLPTGTHNDWPWPFSLISRKATAVEGPPPTEVIFSANFDHAHHNPDVPNEGAWALSLHTEYGFSFAYVKDRWLVAVGTFRYDYSLGYYTFPRFTVKKIKT